LTAPTQAIQPSPGPVALSSSTSLAESAPAAAAPTSTPADLPHAAPGTVERALDPPTAPQQAPDVEMQDAAAVEPAAAPAMDA